MFLQKNREDPHELSKNSCAEMPLYLNKSCKAILVIEKTKKIDSMPVYSKINEDGKN